MVECVYPIVMDSGRPLIVLEEHHNILALLDTGACIPVWTGKEDYLKQFFSASLLTKDVSYSGFGGTAKGNLYKMDFVFGRSISDRYSEQIFSCTGGVKRTFYKEHRDR